MIYSSYLRILSYSEQQCACKRSKCGCFISILKALNQRYCKKKKNTEKLRCLKDYMKIFVESESGEPEFFRICVIEGSDLPETLTVHN